MHQASLLKSIETAPLIWLACPCALKAPCVSAKISSNLKDADHQMHKCVRMRSEHVFSNGSILVRVVVGPVTLKERKKDTAQVCKYIV